jgi:serine/threonine protein kinase
MQLPITIDDRYQIEAELASGGFATVYVGTQLAMQRRVAIKVIVPPPNKSAWTRRVEREARVLAKLKHPSTVTAFDYGTWQGALYLVMEYVDGPTLHKYVREQGPMGWKDVVRLGIDVLGSLQEAHQIGVLHRDLKPANIMIERDSRGRMSARVLDFGIAGLIEGGEQSEAEEADEAPLTGDAFVGTPRYAAPEQLSGQPLTPRADLYAMGLILWECLVGKAAVSSNKIETCVGAHLGAAPWRLPPVEAPAALIALIEQALEKDPEARPHSCEVMLEALEAIRDQISVDGLDRSLNSLEFEVPRQVIDPNLDEAPALLTEPALAPMPRRAQPLRAAARSLAPPQDEAPSHPSSQVTAAAEIIEPARPRHQRAAFRPDEEPVSSRRTFALLGGVLIAMIVLSGLGVRHQQDKERQRQEELDAMAARVPAIKTLPALDAFDVKPAPASVNAALQMLEQAGWAVDSRDEPTVLGNLQVQSIDISRDEAQVRLKVATSSSRDQLRDYFGASKKDPVVYCGTHGFQVAGRNSAGRQAAGELVGRLEVWRATIEREMLKPRR